MFLLIDTSTKNAGIAVYDNGQLINKQIWSSQYNHSQDLFVALENLFSETKLTISDITAIGLALGPGGYSSVRSGVSVGKTIAYTQKIPIFGHNTLDLEASAHQSDEMKICSVIEAGKSVLSYAVFDESGTRVGPDQVSDIESIIEDLDDNTLICGEGVRTYEDTIKQLGYKIAKWDSQIPRIEALGSKTQERHLEGSANDLQDIEPIYARPPSIG